MESASPLEPQPPRMSPPVPAWRKVVRRLFASLLFAFGVLGAVGNMWMLLLDLSERVSIWPHMPWLYKFWIYELRAVAIFASLLFVCSAIHFWRGSLKWGWGFFIAAWVVALAHPPLNRALIHATVPEQIVIEGPGGSKAAQP